MQREKLLPNLQALDQSGETRLLAEVKIPGTNMVELMNTQFLTKDEFECYLKDSIPAKRSAADILTGFFSFYSLEFDPSINCVDIAQVFYQEDEKHITLESFFKGRSIVDRECMNCHLIESHNSDP